MAATASDSKTSPYSVRVIKRSPTRDEIHAEVVDPYRMGWEAGEDLDEPPPNPFKDGLSAKLWRQGFAARVEEYIAGLRRHGGLNVSLT